MNKPRYQRVGQRRVEPLSPPLAKTPASRESYSACTTPVADNSRGLFPPRQPALSVGPSHPDQGVATLGELLFLKKTNEMGGEALLTYADLETHSLI